MALEIYLMRHGETLFNTRHIEQGQCDSPLTAKGIQQAKCAAAYFNDHGITFDTVYSSTLERACDTVEIITKQPYIRRHDLKEINLGTQEAVAIVNEPSYPYGDYYVQFGGEGLDAFTKRITQAMQEIAKKEDTVEEKTVLIVSHGMAMRQFMGVIGGPGRVPPNCGIAHIHFKNNKFQFLELIDPLKLYEKS